MTPDQERQIEAVREAFARERLETRIAELKLALGLAIFIIVCMAFHVHFDDVDGSAGAGRFLTKGNPRAS